MLVVTRRAISAGHADDNPAIALVKKIENVGGGL
jgi:hypothetical protein